MSKVQKKDDSVYFSFKDQFRYWFDNRMAKGSFGLIRLLIAASLVLALLVAGIIIAFGLYSEGDTFSVIWDSITRVINAWMPFSDESHGGVAYLILMTVSALAGVLFTSVFIGIVTSAIEQKVVDLKHGNSKVVESGHTVILGFNPGEYNLINQLILSADGGPGCIVVADNMSREEMEECIRESVEVPKDFKIICRTVNILDPGSIDKCSLETCRNIIVHPTNDKRTIKILLAVAALMKKRSLLDKPMSAIISKKEHSFPPSLAEKNNIIALQTNDALAKIIAHSCTQIGLSQTFKEVFSFEGSELYIVAAASTPGMMFGDLMTRLDNAVPLGISRDGVISLNPPSDMVLEKDDKLVIFADSAFSYKVVPDNFDGVQVIVDNEDYIIDSDNITKTVILGYNDTLPVILRELPENAKHVCLAGKRSSRENQKALEEIAEDRGIELERVEGDLLKGDTLLSVAEKADHIIILNDHDKNEEDADMDVVFLLLNLRELRTNYGFSYNITAEMRLEQNQKLVEGYEDTDYVVASSMSSLFLAQLAESPGLITAFSELLSNDGNELYLKSVRDLGCEGEYTIRELRRFTMNTGMVLLGIKYADTGSVLNQPLDTLVNLKEEDCLIVLAEN